MSRSRQTVIAAFATLLVAAPAAAADCPSADAPPTGANTVEVRAAVVCLTNEQRAAAGLPALVAEGRLEAAAQAYSRRMVAERFFAHVAPDGSTLTDRLAAYTDWSTIGENIAWGEGSLATARSTVRAWMESPGHRANVLNGDFSEIGIGVALGSPVGSTGPAATMTQNFGARRSTAAGAPVSGTAA
ncbi:MAG: hypothetical protein JWO90_643, partial [Solirubrobacterales bacterium]|nr:hypothetical protein [Solirubrobacterales bacterium]